MRDNESMILCQWCGETQDWCACGATCPDDYEAPIQPDTSLDIPEPILEAGCAPVCSVCGPEWASCFGTDCPPPQLPVPANVSAYDDLTPCCGEVECSCGQIDSAEPIPFRRANVSSVECGGCAPPVYVGRE